MISFWYQSPSNRLSTKSSSTQIFFENLAKKFRIQRQLSASQRVSRAPWSSQLRALTVSTTKKLSTNRAHLISALTNAPKFGGSCNFFAKDFYFPTILVIFVLSFRRNEGIPPLSWHTNYTGTHGHRAQTGWGHLPEPSRGWTPSCFSVFLQKKRQLEVWGVPWACREGVCQQPERSFQFVFSLRPETKVEKSGILGLQAVRALQITESAPY
jgi:hypothetical protein